ncbi:hypothetical protein ElyMa_001585400 [Elysia marginata]|uniref:Uncharacterized protein n=1 Tax=Elysia marginata TaxID=1093978 RepID=A0AAV4JF90_9GAST|nr:hypothetical protein ElyMa_001585400 [Elysia marginata]
MLRDCFGEMMTTESRPSRQKQCLTSSGRIAYLLSSSWNVSKPCGQKSRPTFGRVQDQWWQNKAAGVQSHADAHCYTSFEDGLWPLHICQTL